MGDMRVFSGSEGRVIESRELRLVRNVSDACGSNRTGFLVSVFHDLSRTNKKQYRFRCAEGLILEIKCWCGVLCVLSRQRRQEHSFRVGAVCHLGAARVRFVG